jgi:hypothetical protein
VSSIDQTLWAMSAMASYGVAVCFLRFWRTTRDRLFAFFSVAFLLMGLSWTVLTVARPAGEPRHLIYLVRLAAFVIIAVAILDKNRKGRSS